MDPLSHHRHQSNDDGDDPDEAAPWCGAALTEEVKDPPTNLQTPSQETEDQKTDDDDSNESYDFHNIL